MLCSSLDTNNMCVNKSRSQSLNSFLFDTFYVINFQISKFRCSLIKLSTQMQQKQLNKGMFSDTIYLYQFKRYIINLQMGILFGGKPCKKHPPLPRVSQYVCIQCYTHSLTKKRYRPRRKLCAPPRKLLSHINISILTNIPSSSSQSGVCQRKQVVCVCVLSVRVTVSCHQCEWRLLCEGNCELPSV